MSASAWIVVVTKQGRERDVKARLLDQGFEVYLPMRLVESRDGSYPRPFFPGYLFARITLEVTRWQAILSTVGVSRVLCTATRPHGVKDELIQRIRAREVDGLLHLSARPERRFARGQRVTTLDGAVDAIFAEALDSKRAIVLASLFNSSSVRITVDLQKLVALDEAA